MTLAIIRDMTLSKEDFLFWLYNKFGCDYSLAYNFKLPDGTLGWSKHYLYSRLMEFSQDDYIPELKMTRYQFVKRASHRTILDIEIILDIDDDTTTRRNFFSIKDKAHSIINELESIELDYACYFTGNKSYHISIILPDLRDMYSEDRRKYKNAIIKFFGCDSLKSGNNVMIALEGELHYKSGKIKGMVRP